MSFESDRTFYPSTWSYAAQADTSTTDDPAPPYHTVDAYEVPDPQNFHSAAVHTLDNNELDYSALYGSPSASPISSDHTTTSVPETPSYPVTQLQLSSSFPYHVDRTGRSHSYPPARSHSRPSRSIFPEPEPPIIHETFEVATGEDEVFNTFIHRLSDEEKRGMNFSPANRPTFFCMIEGCNRFLLHRAQVKPHLADHGYRFKKPYRCNCGAEFGRQVEAARHVEDKKPCEQCHRSGRKYKGGTVCLRCLRHHPGN